MATQTHDFSGDLYGGPPAQTPAATVEIADAPGPLDRSRRNPMLGGDLDAIVEYEIVGPSVLSSQH